MEWTRRGAMGRRMVRGSLGEQALPDHLDLTLEGFATTTGWARAGFLVAMASMDLRAAGPVIGEVPTTVLVGTRDTLTPVRSGRALAEGIPSAQLRILPGMGHMLPLEAPDDIVAAISAMTGALVDTDR
jgi:pimeloyl-ACP methyl ester carboxylesterase